MSLGFDVEQRQGYAVLRLHGEPTLGQFLSCLHVVGIEAAGWPVRRALLDLRGVRSLTTLAQHTAVGAEAAQQLQHLQRVASLVTPDRLTRGSEEAARRSGLDLRVFTDEAEAIAWLGA